MKFETCSSAVSAGLACGGASSPAVVVCGASGNDASTCDAFAEEEIETGGIARITAEETTEQAGCCQARRCWRGTPVSEGARADFVSDLGQSGSRWPRPSAEPQGRWCECPLTPDSGMGVFRADAPHLRSGDAETLPDRERAEESIEGLWVSEGGSLYWCDGTDFTCVSVGQARFAFWIGKVAVRVVAFSGRSGSALQAFRNLASGEFTGWKPIGIELSGDLLTKHFPTSIPPEHLIYGYTEQYRRVRADVV